MHPAPRTNWYRRKQEQDRVELDQLESEYQKRIKSLEEMEDNRKSRVADKVRLQQTQVGTTTSRQRGATLGSTSASGQSWSAVVKSAANATPASPTATSSSVSTRSDGIKTPSKNTRSESKAETTHRRQRSGGSTGGSPVRGRGASPSRSSIQAGTVRKMQGSFTSSTSSTQLSTKTSNIKSTSENRTRLSARSVTNAVSKPVSLAPYAPTAAPYSPAASVSATSANRTRIARSPSISPTISAIASTFSGPHVAPATSTANVTRPSLIRGTTTIAVNGSSPKSTATPPKTSAPSSPVATRRTVTSATLTTNATRTTPTITVNGSKSAKTSSGPSSPSTSANSTTTTTNTQKTPRTTTSKPTTATATTSNASNKTTNSTSKSNHSSASSSPTTPLSPPTKRSTPATTTTPITRGRSTSPSPTTNTMPRATTTATPPASTTARPKPVLDSKSSSTTNTTKTSTMGPTTPKVSSPSKVRISAIAAPVTLDPALLKGTRLEMRGHVLVHSHGEQVCVWDISEQSCAMVFSGHTAAVHTVAIRANNVIISASREEVLVWDAFSGKILFQHNGCTAMAAHPALDQIAIARVGGAISLLQPETALPTKTFDGPGGKNEVLALCWASETHLLTAYTNKVKLVDTTSSKVERTYDSHTGTITHVESFTHSPTPSTGPYQYATHFFSLCNKNEVLCWHIATGKVASRTHARGQCSTLFILDDRLHKSLTQQMLPILLDPEGITVIAAKDTSSIKMEEPDISLGISLITSSTPVLLL